MRRVRYCVAMSLDGFIAGPNGESDWIVMDPDIDFRSLMNSFDAILMGRKTYERAKGMGGAAAPGVEAYVFSRTLSPRDVKGARLSSDPGQTIGELKRRPGKDIWLFGGGGLFKSLLDLGLVDSLEVSIVPTLLGAGAPLAPAAARTLALATHRVYPKTGTISLVYALR
jgi:dihydrofolate reductase